MQTHAPQNKSKLLNTKKKKKNRSTSLVVQENGILFFPIKVTEGFGFLFVLFLMIIHNITRVQGETSSHC